MIKLLLLLFVLTDARGSASRKRRQRNKQRRQEAALKAVISEAQHQSNTKHCAEIEDEHLLFTCQNYNLSPKCFVQWFGEQGPEIGEVVDSETERQFLNCWKLETDIYEKSNEE